MGWSVLSHEETTERSYQKDISQRCTAKWSEMVGGVCICNKQITVHTTVQPVPLICTGLNTSRGKALREAIENMQHIQYILYYF